MDFANCYADATRADAYARLEFANTYYLAYRDLPAILGRHVSGSRALDFGCGTGRSTRFLEKLGFQVTGVDISEEMLALARSTDATGDYRLVPEDNFEQLEHGSFDLILSAFTFDNISNVKKKQIFCELAKLLKSNGAMAVVFSSPEIYLHDWASFTATVFPDNARARSGDRVLIIVTDHSDQRPVEDIVCTDETYREIFKAANLEVAETLKPLAHGDEPYAWVNETRIAPWVIYVLKRA
ncbi:MAG TPA: class I SAM-dependent methyltransferase [Candidatus Angelobacter sp.]|nr:class I SAM-dependent methyltransferase [Candidatus Angelobacter sp.]